MAMHRTAERLRGAACAVPALCEMLNLNLLFSPCGRMLS